MVLSTVAARGEGSEYSAAVSIKLLNELNTLRLRLDGAEVVSRLVPVHRARRRRAGGVWTPHRQHTGD